MPQLCTVCQHPNRQDIDRALATQTDANRRIATQYGLSEPAVRRHKGNHLPEAMSKAQEVQEIAFADDLLAQVKALRNKAISLLNKAELAGDYRTALAGVREARSCLELLAEMEGELDRSPKVNILIAPQWLIVRSGLLRALEPYPAAKVAVAQQLLQIEGMST